MKSIFNLFLALSLKRKAAAFTYRIIDFSAENRFQLTENTY
ncbi:hypothetical protein DB41_IE00060 [Neochlamydia sp. TUME1]|nr:hypothetical protein DB41_IE00060 [Neochlamydia sp. TUME1]